ncbi:MAG: hypothetical protein ABL860_08180 [Candidatus Nitrotoga sp.]
MSQRKHYSAINYGLPLIAGFIIYAVLTTTEALAAKTADIRGTKHNFSSTPAGTPTPTGTVLDRGIPNSGATRPDGSLEGGGSRASDVQDSVRQTEAATQICVFCHNPHGATMDGNNPAGPIWNRKLSSATYQTYTSKSMDSVVILGQPQLEQPGGSSKLCLSCHDGTLAIGNVNVANGISERNGQPGQNIALNIDGVRRTDDSFMREGAGATTGFTRRLGTDLTNDHPISINFNNAQALRDGELRPLTADANQRWPDNATPVVGVRTPTSHPKIKLETPPGGGPQSAQVQCATCHDPHLRESDPNLGNQKFLRLNRFQEAPPSAQFNQTNDIICLACHDRNLEGQANLAGPWSFSSHAKAQSATSVYKPSASMPAIALREFPENLPIWRAACLNCHDTHTVQGSRRILREGVDTQVAPGQPKTGGNPAIEETCFTCHSNATTSVVSNPTRPPPDIKTDFTTLNRRMPVTTAVQGLQDLGGNGIVEVHNISGQITDLEPNCSSPTNKCGSDFVEQRANLGRNPAGDAGPNPNLANRHVECTDCHNPHRVVPFRNFLGNPLGSLSGDADASGTHPHYNATNVPAGEANAGAPFIHTNIASGPLRGIYGVEPVYTSATFGNIGIPTDFIVKRGDPGTSSSTLVTEPYLTREYQICLKCHSNFGFSDSDLPSTLGNKPNLRITNPAGQGTTPSGTNGLLQYTNIAKEIQAPSGHTGGGTQPLDSGAFAGTSPQGNVVNFQTNNRRGWHPVIGATGRTPNQRGAGVGGVNGDLTPNIWNLPWSNGIGIQTMYCTDCHGSSTPLRSVIPVGGEPNGSSSTSGINPWGPHGSNHNFLLKGAWDRCTGTETANGGGPLANCLTDSDGLNGGPITGPNYPDGNRITTQNDICFKCHDYDNYATPNPPVLKISGFSGPNAGVGDPRRENLHVFHASVVGAMRCTWCHVAVPHGWKNKVLLANLNDVGPEALCRLEEIADGINCIVGQPIPAGTQVRAANLPNPTIGSPTAVPGLGPANYWAARGYTNPPYYLNARLKVRTFANSGTWVPDSCGNAGPPGDAASPSGIPWMMNSDENCGGSL